MDARRRGDRVALTDHRRLSGDNDLVERQRGPGEEERDRVRYRSRDVARAVAERAHAQPLWATRNHERESALIVGLRRGRPADDGDYRTRNGFGRAIDTHRTGDTTLLREERGRQKGDRGKGGPGDANDH